MEEEAEIDVHTSRRSQVTPASSGDIQPDRHIYTSLKFLFTSSVLASPRVEWLQMTVQQSLYLQCWYQRRMRASQERSKTLPRKVGRKQPAELQSMSLHEKVWSEAPIEEILTDRSNKFRAVFTTDDHSVFTRSVLELALEMLLISSAHRIRDAPEIYHLPIACNATWF